MNLDPMPYQQAQHALVELKTAVLRFLEAKGKKGARNVQVGRSLGIYAGHIGHVGHIPRTLLALLEAEGVVRQDVGTKKWFLRKDEELEKDKEETD